MSTTADHEIRIGQQLVLATESEAHRRGPCARECVRRRWVEGGDHRPYRRT
ncbi:Uncharacterised protein [Mycobacteroides abscessus subsp. abscessus]|nr:Uncharacterised protein [Mycobacteroides abscessus subsp. abscessus]